MISSSSLAKKKNNMASLVQTARSPSPDARSMNRNVKVRERTSEGNSEFRVFCLFVLTCKKETKENAIAPSTRHFASFEELHVRISPTRTKLCECSLQQEAVLRKKRASCAH